QAAIESIRLGFAKKPDSGLLIIGLSIVLWNYCGWDNISTFAGEVDNPRRNYPRALTYALPLIISSYLLPILAGIAATTDRSVWSETAGWPIIAQFIGGHIFGVILAGAALISTWALFSS